MYELERLAEGMGSVASVIAQHMDRTPPFDELAILPAEVVAVLRRMLEKDRGRRIQTPTALRSELRFCIERLRRREPKPNLSEFGERNLENLSLAGLFKHPLSHVCFRQMLCQRRRFA